jgi:hypothetical protein
MGGPRGSSLRENLVGRVMKKLGKHHTEYTDKEVGFIFANVDALIMSGSVAVQDVNSVVQKFRTVFPDYNKPEPKSARSPDAPKSPKSPLGAPRPPYAQSSFILGPAKAVPLSKSPPPAYAPLPPGGATSRGVRLGAIARENRMVRDQEWARLVEEDTKAFQESRRREREADQAKRDEQRRFLEHQVLEHRRREQEQQEELREHSKNVIKLSQAELDQERHEREAAKRKMMEERAKREKVLADHLEAKRRDQERQMDEERRYLREIQDEEMAKKDAEAKKKLQSRSQFQRYISDNRAAETQKREQENAQRERERLEVEEARKRQYEREEQARAEIQRKSVLGDHHARKQQMTMQQYEEHRQRLEADARAEAERIAKVQEEKNRKEAEQQEFHHVRKQQLKTEFNQDLGRQINERERAKEEAKRDDVVYRRAFSTTNENAAKSDALLREKTAQRKEELQRSLERQIAEKQVRDRYDVKTRI